MKPDSQISVVLNAINRILMDLLTCGTSYMVLLFKYLKWAWSILLHRSFFNHHLHRIPQELIELMWHRTYGLDPRSFEPVECTVCLSTIGEDEEIKELRCGHLFHRVCLDQWLEFRNTTCPLCRDCLVSSPVVSEIGDELLVFNYFSTSDSHDEGLWWLR
ncbi:hypothetical protein L6452_18230 [Arctium lappa]|uniref:Uncharacterized protein n=1 Tax=Arctium lappa TaxID=4217 RepID=A0ACB9C5K4_ARCLA|nr:hypothetical protein L6452_18230 [Arctium lappa]